MISEAVFEQTRKNTLSLLSTCGLLFGTHAHVPQWVRAVTQKATNTSKQHQGFEKIVMAYCDESNSRFYM